MVITDNLLAYYKLDETSGAVLDAHGSNDGTNNGATVGATGKIGDAYNFDTSGDYVNLTTGFSDAKTINAWIKIDATNWESYATIITKGYNEGFSIRRAGPTGTQIWFEVYTSSGTYRIISSTIPDDTWTMLTWVWNTSANKLYAYINGVYDGEVSTVGTTMTGSTSQVRIGERTSYIGSDGSYRGVIDEVGIWSRALTSDEITTLYNSGNGLTYPFIVQKTLTITAGVGGNIIAPSYSPVDYDIDEVVIITAIQFDGYTFNSWTGDTDTIEDTNAISTTITMEDDYTIEATFDEIPTYTSGQAMLKTNYPKDDGIFIANLIPEKSLVNNKYKVGING